MFKQLLMVIFFSTLFFTVHSSHYKGSHAHGHMGGVSMTEKEKSDLEEYEREIFDTFQTYNDDKDGTITREEMAELLKHEFPVHSKQETNQLLDELFGQYDEHEEGMTLEEFRHMVKTSEHVFVDPPIE